MRHRRRRRWRRRRRRRNVDRVVAFELRRRTLRRALDPIAPVVAITPVAPIAEAITAIGRAIERRGRGDLGDACAAAAGEASAGGLRFGGGDVGRLGELRLELLCAGALLADAGFELVNTGR